MKDDNLQYGTPLAGTPPAGTNPAGTIPVAGKRI